MVYDRMGGRIPKVRRLLVTELSTDSSLLEEAAKKAVCRRCRRCCCCCAEKVLHIMFQVLMNMIKVDHIGYGESIYTCCCFFIIVQFKLDPSCLRVVDLQLEVIRTRLLVTVRRYIF